MEVDNSDVLICDQCGCGVIKNGLAVRKQRWKCINKECRKGFYTEIEKECKFVDPFDAIKGKWVECGRCGIETVNVGGYCNGCQVLIEMDGFVNGWNNVKVLNGIVDNISSKVDGWVSEYVKVSESERVASEQANCFVGNWESEENEVEQVSLW